MSGDYHQLFFKGFLKCFTRNPKLISFHHARTIRLINLLHGSTLTEIQWLLMYLVYHCLNWSFIHNKSSYSKIEVAAVFVDYDYAMVENTVLVAHDCVTGYIIMLLVNTRSIQKSNCSCSLIRETAQTQTFQEKLQILSQINGKKTLRSWYTSNLRQWFAYAASSFYLLQFKRYM